MQHSRANRAQALILIAIILVGVAVVLIALSALSNRARASPVVVEAYWQNKGNRVSTAPLGTEVDVHVIIQAPEEYVGSIVVKVRKDVAFWTDSDYQTSTFPVNLAAGDEKDLTMTFEPDQTSSSGFRAVRGYFLEVQFKVTGNSWIMEDSYPPRLRVTSLQILNPQ